MGWRIAFEKALSRTRQPLRLAVLGAGKSGQAFYEMLEEKKDYEIVAYLDDDEKKWGSAVGGVPVVGGSDDIPDLVRGKKSTRSLWPLPTRFVRRSTSNSSRRSFPA